MTDQEKLEDAFIPSGSHLFLIRATASQCDRVRAIALEHSVSENTVVSLCLIMGLHELEDMYERLKKEAAADGK